MWTALRSRRHPVSRGRSFGTVAPAPTPAGLQFYRNRQLELYANRETKRLSLRQLVFYGRAMSEDRLIKSANYVRMELPVRIAHRIRDMQALPYVVVTQENVAQVYELYWDAFEKFRRFPPITNLEDNARFCDFLRGLLTEHSHVIPALSLGLSLSSKHLSPDELDAFMHKMLTSRISRRVLVEHHVALSTSLNEPQLPASQKHVGIIYTSLGVRESVERCQKLLQECYEYELRSGSGSGALLFPEIVLDGHVDTRFSYIKEHLDYMILELLNNAVRFTRLFAWKRSASQRPAVRITIVASHDDITIRISDNGGGLGEIQDPKNLYSFSHLRNAARLEDDRLGALRSAANFSKGALGMFGFGTVAEQLARILPTTSASPMDGGLAVTLPGSETTMDMASGRTMWDSNASGSRIGLGLPMSSIYAGYFGGSLDLISLDGWGTDAFLKLPKLGTNLEGVEV